MKKNIFLSCFILLFFNCMASIENNISNEHIPTLQNVDSYEEFFESNKEYSLHFQAGILAVDSYINNKKYEKAHALILKILPILLENTYGDEYKKFFEKHIPMAQKIIRAYKTHELTLTEFCEILTK